MFDRFEVKIVDGECEVVAINGTELNCVESYQIDQTEKTFAKVTVSFFAETMNVSVGKKGHLNADTEPGAE